MIASERGFSLIEVVAVLVILAILTALGLGRFGTTQTFEARGFVDQAAALVRYGQKLAIGRHTAIYVAVQADRLQLCRAAGTPCPGGLGAPGPAGETPFEAAAPEGLSISASVANFSFDANGRPSQPSILTFTGPDLVSNLTVEAETGYVH